MQRALATVASILLACHAAVAWGSFDIECKLSAYNPLPNVITSLNSAAGCHQLELSRSKLGVAKLRTLIPAMVTSGHVLREVELKGNLLGDVGVSELVASAPSFVALSELELGSNDVGDAGATSLAAALPLLPSLVDLDLGANRITAVGATQLILAAKASSVVELDLAFNLINDTVLPAVEELFANPAATTVRKLKLSGNLLSPDVVMALRLLEDRVRAAGAYIKISTGKQQPFQRQPGGIMPAASATGVGAAVGSAAGTAGGTGSAAAAAAAVAAAAGPVPPRFALDVSLWTDDDVAAWLKSVSPALVQYADAFTANAVNGETLLALSDQDLSILGVENTFHRTRIMNELVKLKSQTA